MIPQLIGYSLARTIPTSILFGVLNGSLRVCGGVIRNHNGQIMAHLVNAVSPFDLVNPVGAVLSAVNTYQLHRIGSQVTRIGETVAEIDRNVGLLQHATSQILTLSTGTMVLSGLTLGVSTAGFVFLNHKLNRIDKRLQELQRHFKELKDFLKMKQNAELTTALNTLRDIATTVDDDTRRALLVHSRQTLGALHHHYRAQFSSAQTEIDFSAAEEYFTITAIAHALCAGELDMHETAARDIVDAYECWSRLCRQFTDERILGSNPARFLDQRYASSARVDTLLDWMDFARNKESGMDWLEEMRTNLNQRTWWRKGELSEKERFEVELVQKLTAKNRVFDGYCTQYRLLEERRMRPSNLTNIISNLDKSKIVNQTLILVANETTTETESDN